MKLCSAISVLACWLFVQGAQSRRRQIWNTGYDDETEALPPSFRDTPTQVTFIEGQLARLECSVDNLGTKKIIWRRKSDPNPLTIDRKTFVDDTRVGVENEPLAPDWFLTIKQVRLDDAGDYECQVSSTDRLLRRYIRLQVKPGIQVVDPEITISGKTFVEKNHKLRLVCKATGGKNSPDDLDVDWFLNGQKLNSDQEKRIQIMKSVSLMKKTISSTLEVASVDMSDAGIYVCRASDLSIASTRVDVLNAESMNVKRGTEKDSSQDSARKDRLNQDGDNNHAVSKWTPSTALIFFATFLAIGVAWSQGKHNWSIFPT